MALVAVIMNAVIVKLIKRRITMKKLILLFTLTFIMCGCIPNTPYSIVTKVHKANSQCYPTHYKYVVKTDNGLRFYTDETFNVGDTIQITMKN